MALKDPHEINIQMKRESEGVGDNEIRNTSSVSGESTADALNTLLAATGTLPFVAKGDILTYSGKAAAVQTVGTDGMVPVADSSAANGWEWKANPASIPRTFAYTVGASGADYTKISTLLAAHAAPKSIFVMDGTYNESAADLTIPANTTVFFESPAAIISMGAKSFIMSAGSVIIGGTIQGTLASADLVKMNGAGSKLLGTAVTSLAVGNPGAQYWLINAASSILNVIIDNVKLTFAGDWANEGGIKFRSLSGRISSLLGICSVTGLNTKLIDALSEGLVIDGVDVTGLAINSVGIKAVGTSGKVVLQNIGSMNNALGSISATVNGCEVSKSVFRAFDGSGDKISQCHIMSYTPSADTAKNFISDSILEAVQLVNASKDYFSNCYIIAMTNAAVVIDAIFSGCKFGTALNVLGDAIMLGDCEFDNNLTLTGNHNKVVGGAIAGDIVVAGNFNTMNGLRVGAVAGGGAQTITVSGGATSNMIIGCMTDDVISDSGTTTCYTAEDNVVF